ncbi:radical SAM protein [bacterium]|nr:radical SAM protein [bacterium]
MRFTRVLLISPPSSSYLGAARPPQNLGYLAQALEDSGIEYDVLDMRLNRNSRDLYRKIDEFAPDLIGVSLVSLEYLRSYALIRDIKTAYPEVTIIAGGPHVTVTLEKVMQECPELDFAVAHEGEGPLVEFCRGSVPVEDQKGLLRRENGVPVFNGHYPLAKDLDAIAWPRYTKFELDRYIAEMPFNSSRGCPHKCVFCPNKMITKKFRWRSPEHVVDEIEYWFLRGYRIFNYDDDNFGYFPERVYRICDEIERRGITGVEFRCSNGLRADKVDRPLLARMREVGFNYIAFGVDGGNNKMLKLNKKGESIEEIETAIRIACDLDFDVKIFVITGMPGETKADIQDSLDLVMRYPVKRVILNNPIPYPGTELYDTVMENGWFITRPEVYLNSVTEDENEPVFTTPELSYQDRVEILKICRRTEKQVTRNAIYRMYRRFGPLARLAGYIFASGSVQRMFFLNMRFRRLIERIRFKRMLRKQAATAKGVA